jgi:hypothetical protein
MSYVSILCSVTYHVEFLCIILYYIIYSQMKLIKRILSKILNLSFS